MAHLWEWNGDAAHTSVEWNGNTAHTSVEPKSAAQRNSGLRYDMHRNGTTRLRVNEREGICIVLFEHSTCKQTLFHFLIQSRASFPLGHTAVVKHVQHLNSNWSQPHSNWSQPHRYTYITQGSTVVKRSYPLQRYCCPLLALF